MNRAGDPSKQPEICRKPVFTPYTDEYRKEHPFAIGSGNWSQCPNIYETSSYVDFDGEQYYCDVCGKAYYLDYEDMK